MGCRRYWRDFGLSAGPTLLFAGGGGSDPSPVTPDPPSPAAGPHHQLPGQCDRHIQAGAAGDGDVDGPDHDRRPGAGDDELLARVGQRLPGRDHVGDLPGIRHGGADDVVQLLGHDLRGAGAPYVATLNGKIATLATVRGVTLVDLYKDFAAAGTRLIGVDGLHPTEAGYTEMATSFYNAIAARFETKKVTVRAIR